MSVSFDSPDPDHPTQAVAQAQPGDCQLLESGPELAIVSLSGEADLALAPRLSELLASCAGCDLVLIEMSGCTFMDSSVIATLLDAARRLRSGRSRGLALIGPTGAPAKILELTGTLDWLPVFASREAALEATGGSAA